MLQVRAVFDAATAAFAEAARVVSPAPAAGQPLLAATSAAAARPVVGPLDIEREVLQWLHEEEAVPAPYLQAAVDAYSAAAEAHGVAVPASLHLLALDVVLQQGHALQAAAALVAQPDLASPEAADRLEAAAELGELAGAARLVDSVRARLGLHTLRCRALLRQGHIVRALRLARRHKVESLPPAAFLHAAAESGTARRTVVLACHRLSYFSFYVGTLLHANVLKRAFGYRGLGRVFLHIPLLC